MIVCHKYKFIFVKTQKTASTSLETALSGLCNSSDIVTAISKNDEVYRSSLGFQTPVNYKIPFKKYSKRDFADFIITGKRKEFYNHMSCLEIKENIGSNIYDSYYKFCFERNPYDKLVSLFYHHGGFNKWASIEEFITAGELNIIKGFDQYTINKNVAVDDVFKFEEMNKALTTISTKLNLDFNLTLPEVKLKSEFKQMGYKF